MKKIKSFLNSLEEKFLFRYGKRTWQIISFLAIIALSFAVVYYSINAIPASREEVTISKMEFDKNKIDEDFDESNNVDECTMADYKRCLDSLKRAMPKSEWNKLGDSVEVTRYTYREEYDPWFGFYNARVPYQVKEYQKNYDAVPNILEDIFSYKGIDSTQFCERIKVLRMIKELNNFTKKEEATRMLREYYKGIMIYNNNLTLGNIREITAIYKKIEGKIPFFKDPYEDTDSWNEYREYIDVFRNDSITESRLLTTNTALDNLKKKGTVKKPEAKHRIARLVLSSSLVDEDIEKAAGDFFTSSDFKYEDKTVIGIFSKYHRLFNKKVKLAEKLLAERKLEKEANRQFSRDLAMYSFATIMGIATILLLFSIRAMMKERNS